MRFFAWLLAILSLLLPARAVEGNYGTSAYNYYDPSVGTPSNPSGSVSGWTSGWASTSTSGAVTGWDYVGVVANPAGSASGTYLGNGWVLTAAHVGSFDFTLNGVTYPAVAGSGTNIYNSDSTQADLCLYQVSPPMGGSLPDLPPLTLATTDPTTFSRTVMIGEGGGKSWGRNRVSGTNYTVPLSGYPYVSNDFYTIYSSTGTQDQAILISGDSGGGDFIYDSSKSLWELSGINEAVGSDGNGNPVSFMVQLSTYSSQINAVAAPEPGTWALLASGIVLLAGRQVFRSRKNLRFLGE